MLGDEGAARRLVLHCTRKLALFEVDVRVVLLISGQPPGSTTAVQDVPEGLGVVVVVVKVSSCSCKLVPEDSRSAKCWDIEGEGYGKHTQ